jgi:hypothetical protein
MTVAKFVLWAKQWILMKEEQPYLGKVIDLMALKHINAMTPHAN